MSVTLDIPDQLAERLRVLAHERGVSVDDLGQQALAVGITMLAGGTASETVNIAPSYETRLPPRAVVSMRSPIVTTDRVRRRPIAFESPAEGMERQQ
jgi:hypothetical protein